MDYGCLLLFDTQVFCVFLKIFFLCLFSDSLRQLPTAIWKQITTSSFNVCGLHA